MLPDVIAIEELDHYSDWALPELRARGYAGLYAQKPNSACKYSNNPSLSDGSALFWRTKTVELISGEVSSLLAACVLCLFVSAAAVKLSLARC